MRWAVWFDTGLRGTPARLTTNGSSASDRFGTGSPRTGGWVRGGLRAEEAGLKPSPTQEGRGGGGKTGGRLGCCRLCGSTRASEGLRPGSPRTDWRRRAGRGRRPYARRDADVGGLVGGWVLWGVWFDTVLRRTPNRLTTNGSSASDRFGTGSPRTGEVVDGLGD